MLSRSRFCIILFVVVLFTLSLSTGAVSHAQADQTEANKAVAAQLYEAFSNSSKLADIGSLVAPDFVNHFPSGDGDWGAFKAGILTFNSAIPDVSYKPLIMIAEGNHVALRYEFSGTFTKPLTDPMSGNVLQPTGKSIAIYANTLLTFTDDNKLKEYQEVFDNLNFSQQLGIIPASEATAAAPITPLDSTVWTITKTSADYSSKLKDMLKDANLTAYNEGKLDQLDAVYAPEYISNPTMRNLAGNKSEIETLRGAIPDLKATADIVIVEGNWVAYHWMVTGTFTHPSDFNGMKLTPTNKPVRLDGIVLAYANEKGQIVADWNELDNLSIAMQFGLIPAN